jgi:hypothetical protein
LDFGLDFILTEILECLALITTWRGAENNLDIHVYPNDPLYKILVSFVASHSIYLFVAFIQTFVHKRVANTNVILVRLVTESLMYIVMFLSSVFLWKFYWDFMDSFVFTTVEKFWVYLIGHFLMFFVAVCLKVSSILVGPGTSFMDSEILKSENAYFEVNYLTTIYRVSFFVAN